MGRKNLAIENEKLRKENEILEKDIVGLINKIERARTYIEIIEGLVFSVKHALSGQQLPSIEKGEIEMKILEKIVQEINKKEATNI